MTEAADRAGQAGAPQRAQRPQRRARRDDTAAPSKPARIVRRIPYFDLLDPDSLQKIDDHAERILGEVGIEFRDDDVALSLFRQAGAKVDGNRLRFDKGLIFELVRSAPSQFTQHARNPERSVVVGGDNTVFSPAYGSPFVRDLEGGRRYGTLVDFENFVKLAYATPWLHHSGGTICEPVDIAVNKRHLDMVYAHLRWSDKPFMGSVTAPERAKDSIEMARIAFGSDFVDKNCVIMGNINVNSPLVYDDTMSKAVRAYAEANQCTVVVPFILGGAMGPVTPAGAIAQAHAEALVGVALTQLVRRGSPVIYGNFLSTMSLRTGAPTFGMPEAALAYMAVGQLARKHRLPLRCGGHFTASKVADAQAAQESADAMTPALMAGTNFVLHSAGWLEGGLTMGYEKFVLDCDRLGMMHRLMAGLDLDENGFAMDAFHECGPGKHFLGAAHTLANYQTAYFEPALSDCNSFEQWQEEGSKSAERRALDRWRKILREYQAPPIDAGVDDGLRDFVARRKGEAPDRWH
jgi:trimethylamine--corrinoid protein Co-methyltransferase